MVKLFFVKVTQVVTSDISLDVVKGTIAKNPAISRYQSKVTH